MEISEYEEQIELKDMLIEGLEKRYDEVLNMNALLKERVIELNKALKEKQEYEMVRDINYWKGIEKAYIDKLDEYLERIIKLEKQNSFLQWDIDELREKLEAMENV